MKFDPNMRFEILAEVFRYYYGFLAPGKDESPHMYREESHDKMREDAWRDFIDKDANTVRCTLDAIERLTV